MRFYFTVHPGDLMRTRLLEGADIMIVASAFWDVARRRFRIRRPPADHIGRLTIDSGGFTAAKRWGVYPWSHEQYVQFICDESRDVPLTLAACMDYACERGVNREQLATNQDRIRVTIENELRLRDVAPDLPWLGVLQGNTREERAMDVRIRRRLGLIHATMGIGSICGRPAREAAEVIRFYGRMLPGTRFHGFGLDARTVDRGDDVALLVASWDSYAWTWPRGKKSDRPSFLRRDVGETRSAFTLRMAREYERQAIAPRLHRPRQIALTEHLFLEGIA